MKIKTGINQWDLIKLNILCIPEETTHTHTHTLQPTEWDKIFAKEVIDKGLISKIYKHVIELYVKKNQKMGRRTK